MSAAVALAAFAALAGGALAAETSPQLRQPKPSWIIEGLSNPESVAYDEKTAAIYVSNVNGDPGAKDGNGFITKADLSGKVAKKKWVKGLNAPKGLGVCGGKLYAADIDEIAVIDLASAKIERTIAAPDARMLNDVVLAADCVAYVSDTLSSTVFRLDAAKIERWSAGPELQSPNGLALDGGKLYVAAWGLTTDWTVTTPGRLLSVDLKTQQRAEVPGPHGNLDGLQKTALGWLVSDWSAGTVMLAAPNGQTRVLVNGIGGAADIGYLSSRDLVLVPRMKDDRLDAYKLAELAK